MRPLNLTILVNKDIASCLALNFLMNLLSQHRISVFYSSRVGSKPLCAPLQQLKFFEQDFFNDFVFPLQARLPSDQRGDLLGFDQICSLLEGRCSPLNNINKEEGLVYLADSKPDLILSIRYGLILQEQVISIPKLGVLNLHSGKLPEYQGVMASFRALLHGDTELGTTLHRIVDSGIDTGPIIDRSSFNVVTEKSYFWHVLALYEEGCSIMANAVNELAQGRELRGEAQAGAGSYYGFPQEEDCAALDKRGFKLFEPIEVLGLARRFCTVE